MADLPTILAHWGMVLLQLLAAAVCGGLIGYQRETFARPAGFRTHVLVCVGSAIFMMVSVVTAGGQFDPGRIAAQVATGIGFIGAGTIIHEGSVVRGLTTASSLWAVAGIGLAAGFGGQATAIALLGTLVVYLALGPLRRIERHIGHGRLCTLVVCMADTEDRAMVVRDVLGEFDFIAADPVVTHTKAGNVEVRVEVRASSGSDLAHAIAELERIPGVASVRRECR